MFSKTANGDIKNDDGCLEDRHADDLLDQVVLGQHGIKTDHHEQDVYPVIVIRNNRWHYNPLSYLPRETILKYIEITMAMTAIATPISIPSIPWERAMTLSVAGSTLLSTE